MPRLAATTVCGMPWDVEGFVASLGNRSEHTRRAYEHDVAQARAAGADGHMSKPVNYQALSEVLQAVERDRSTGPNGAAPSDAS